ncbi:MAG: hypothetical protein ACHQ0J_08415 [Candidatus Dormibacterales bacterium]
MNLRFRFAVVVALAALVSACGSSSSPAAQSGNSPSGSTPSAASTSTPDQNQNTAGLDPEVPAPSGFPSNVPVYPGARLTTGSSYNATGNTTYGMEWETHDSVSQVQAYYSSQLSQGDWSLTYSANSGGTFGAGFSQKSNQKVTGILAVASDNGITKITLSFVVLG